MAGRTSGKGNIPFGSHESIDPKGPGRTDVAKREPFCGTVERLKPKGDLCAVVPSEQEGLTVRHPNDAQYVAIDGAGDIFALSAFDRSYVDFIFIRATAVAGIPIGHLGSIGRKQAETFKFFMFRKLADRARVSG